MSDTEMRTLESSALLLAVMTTALRGDILSSTMKIVIISLMEDIAGKSIDDIKPSVSEWPAMAIPAIDYAIKTNKATRAVILATTSVACAQQIGVPLDVLMSKIQKHITEINEAPNDTRH